ncbi:hypothetical protein EVJ58_g1550, partial [Rhodofomes roseus]
AAMPEPSPIAEHPEHTDSPPPDEPPARQEPTPVPTIRLPKRESTLPPLPTPPADLTVPTVDRVGSAPATPYSATPQPILAPTPGRPRAAMPASSTPVTGPSQPRQGSSSDESPTEDHVFVQRPASQTRPRLESRRNLSSLSHAPHASDGGAPITYPARTLSYNEHRRHRSLRADRPERPSSAASVPAGVGPDRYSAGLSRALTLDYVVPTVDPEKKGSEMGLSNTSEGERTVKQRLMRTLEHAQKERDASKRKAMMSSYALNICIGIQIILGAITTGVAAASTTSRTSTSVGIPILGGLSTLSASYLARARGSGEPELSIVRQHDLDHFIRDTEAFLLDRGHLIGPQYDAEPTEHGERRGSVDGRKCGRVPIPPAGEPRAGGPADAPAGPGPGSADGADADADGADGPNGIYDLYERAGVAHARDDASGMK